MRDRAYGHSKFDILRGLHLGPPFLREEEVIVGGHRSYHWKERWWFPIGLSSPVHCDHCTPLVYLNHSAAICHQMSAKHNSTGWGVSVVKILGCSALSIRSVTLGL